MIYQLITIVAVVLAGLWASFRLTIVGFGLTSTILVGGLVLWTVLTRADSDVLLVGLGFWLLFNASFFVSGIALTWFGGDLGQVRRPISMKDAKSQ